MQYFTIDFICTYNMIKYPFDTQRCNGTLAPKTNSKYFVKLMPDKITYLGPIDLMKYIIDQNVSWIPQKVYRYI